MDNTTMFDDLKKEIKECKSLSELKDLVNALKNMSAFTKRYIEKIKLEMPFENTKKPSITSINRIAQFLNEIIFNKNIKEIKRSDLYKIYKEWNKKEPNKKTYGKQKLYSIMNLGKRVQLRHKIDGDYFIFELNDQIDNT